VPEPEQLRLFEIRRSDQAFLTKVGIKPCVIRCFRPQPPAVALIREHPPRLTKQDAQLLKACGVAWEPEPAVQLPLDFSGCRTKEHDPKEPVSPRKEEST
jgi:hypothetical protein